MCMMLAKHTLVVKSAIVKEKMLINKKAGYDEITSYVDLLV